MRIQFISLSLASAVMLWVSTVVAGTAVDTYESDLSWCPAYAESTIAAWQAGWEQGHADGACEPVLTTANETDVFGQKFFVYYDNRCGGNYGQLCRIHIPPASYFGIATNVSTTKAGTKSPVLACGSTIDVAKKTVSETIPLSRIPFDLVYSSEYNGNRISNNTIAMDFNFTTNNSSVYQLVITPNGGSSTKISYPLIPIIHTNFIWDGITGTDPAKPFFKQALFHVEFDLLVQTDPTYMFPTIAASVFDQDEYLGYYNPAIWGLGGWTISIHHYFDRRTKTIYMGTGSSRSVDGFKTITLAPYGQVDIVVDPETYEAYIFDSLGSHLETRTRFVSATKYKFNYSSDNKITSIQDINGKNILFNRDANGNLTGIVAPFGQLAQVTTNSLGQISLLKNSDGTAYTAAYDARNFLQSFQEPSGLMTAITYDDNGNFLREDKNTGMFQLFTETLSGVVRTISKLTPAGILEENDVSAQGNVQEIIKKDGQGRFISDLVTDYTSFISPLVTLISDDTKTVSSLRLDQQWGLVQYSPFSTNSNATTGSQQSLDQHWMGQSVTLSDTSNPLTLQQLVYTDSQGDGSITKEYTRSSNTLTITANSGPSPEIDTYQLDDKERIVSYHNINSSNQMSVTYNPDGLLSSLTANGAVTSFYYDANGDLISSQIGTSANPAITTYLRDTQGRVIRKTLPNGDFIQFSYASDGSVASITPSSGHQYSFAQSNGLLSDFLAPATSSSSGQTKITYDQNSRVQSKILPSGKNVRYSYRPGSNSLASIQTTDGLWTYNQVDGGERISSASSPDGIATVFTWTGNVPASETIFDTDGSKIISLAFGYDSHSRLQNIGLNGDTTYSSYFNFDFTGRPIYVNSSRFNFDSTTPGVDKVTVTSGNMQTIYSLSPGNFVRSDTTFQKSTGDTVTISQIRTQGGDLQQVNSAQNTVTLTQQSIATAVDSESDSFNYDGNGRLISETKTIGDTTNPSSQTRVDYSFPANSNGNRASVTARTIAGTTASFSNSFDAQDSQTSTSGSVNRSYTYDPDGNLATISNCFGTTHFTYDEMSNLKKVTTPDGKAIEYAVDAFGRRTRKKVNGQVVEYYIWYDQTHLGAILDGNKNLLLQYTYGLIPENGPLSLIKNGRQYFVISDPVTGSVRYVADESGNIVQQISYDGYGNMMRNTNPTFQPLGFASGLYDADTKLVRFGARDYDPTTGRWTAKDPIGFNGGDTNLYGYVADDPVNGNDPSGLYHFVGGAHGPLSPGLDSALKCFDSCTGLDTAITSGNDSHPSSDPHSRGEACDIGRNSNPKLTRTTADSCFDQCFTNAYGQEESNGGPGTHFHYQTVPGVGGATGMAPGVQPHGPAKGR